MNIEIEELNFPDSHEVVGFGRIKLPTRGLERKVEILLRPAEVGRSRDLNAHDIPRSAWVGCGQLDHVTIGSCWRNGEMVGRTFAAKTLTRGVTFVDALALDVFMPAHEDGLLMRVGDMQCYRLLLDRPDDKLRYVWVPVVELLRVLFGVSSHFLVQLFSGVRAPTLARDSGFYSRDPNHSFWVDEDTFRLACYSVPGDNEAVMAAVVTEERDGVPNDLREAHDSVFRNLAVAFTRSGKAPVVAEMAFPGILASGPRNEMDGFKAAPQWTFEGRFVRVSGVAPRSRHAFLITRIIGLEVPLPPFDTLEIKVHQRVADPKGLPPGGRTIVDTSPSTRLQTRVPPGSGPATIEECTRNAILMPAHLVTIVRLERAKGGRRRAFLLRGDRQEPRLGSTDDRVPGGSQGVVHVKLRRKNIGPLGPDDVHPDRMKSLKATFEALKSLSRQHAWRMVRGRGGSDGMPLLEAALSKKRTFMMLLVVIQEGSRFFAAADAGTVTGDPRALGLLARDDNGPFDENQIEAILKFAARNKAHWRGKNLPGFKIMPIQRYPLTILGCESKYQAVLYQGITDLLSQSAAPRC